MQLRRAVLLALVLDLVVCEQYRATWTAALPAPTVPPEEDAGVIMMITSAALQGFNTTNPVKPLWTFSMNASFCCSAAAAASASDSSSSCDSSSPTFYVVRGRGLVLLGCGPHLVVLSTSTGRNLSSFTVPGGDTLSQFAATGEVALVSLQSSRVLALNVTTFDVLWHVQAPQSNQPLVDIGPSETAVVFSFDSSSVGRVDSYVLGTGTHRWSVECVMSPLELSPVHSKLFFVWCGPDYMTVRMVDLATGAFSQWIAESIVDSIATTDEGLVVVATQTRVTVINASKGVVSWAVKPDSGIGRAVVVFGGEYVVVYPPAAKPTVLTLVYSVSSGTPVGDCGYGACAQPCVTSSMWHAWVLLVNCTTSNAESTGLNLLNVHTSTFVALGTPPHGLTGQGDEGLLSVKAMTTDGLVAVMTATTLQYLRIVPMPSPPAPSTHDGPPPSSSVDNDHTVIDAGIAVAIAVLVLGALVAYHKTRRLASPTVEVHLLPSPRVSMDIK